MAATPDLAALTDQVVAALEAAGIRATADKRNLNPPAVWVGELTARFNRLAGYTAVVNLYVTVPATGATDQRRALGPLTDQVRAVWPATYGFPTDLPTPDGGDPLPAYRLTCPVRAS